MNSTWTVVLVSFVSIFGLASCVSDSQSDPSPRVVADSWKLPAPHIEDNLSLEGTLVEGSAKHPLLGSQHPIHAGAKISFLFATPEGAEGLTWKVTSNCRTQDKSDHFQIFTFKNVTAIPVSSLLPASYLLRPGPLSNEPLCVFDFEVKNAHGSTHAFSTPTRAILGLDGLGQVPFEVSTARFQPNVIRGHSIMSKMVGESADEHRETAETAFSLICENFLNQRVVRNGESTDTLIDDLMVGRLEDETGAEVVQDADPRHQKPDQQCRIVTESAEPATGIRRRSLTPAFAARFPLPAVQIKFTKNMLFFENPHLEGKELGTIEIKNPTNTVIALMLPKMREQGVRLQQVYQFQGRLSVSHSNPFRLEAEVGGAQRIVDYGGMTVFEVLPQQSARIALRFRSHLFCMRMTPNDGLESPVNPTMIGGLFELPSGLGLHQFIAWSPELAFSGLPSEPVVVPELDSTSKGEPLLSNWLPRSSWAPQYGSRSQVATIAPPPVAHVESCMDGVELNSITSIRMP